MDQREKELLLLAKRKRRFSGDTSAPAKVVRLPDVSLDDVAAAVRFLVETDFVTGECITVDGGERWGHVRQRFAD